MNEAIAVQSYEAYVRNDNGHALMFPCYQRRSLYFVTGARLATEANDGRSKISGAKAKQKFGNKRNDISVIVIEEDICLSV